MKPTIESYRLEHSTSIDFEYLEAKSRSGDEEAFDEISRELLKKKSWKKIPMLNTMTRATS
jgi:hypothetical protein